MDNELENYSQFLFYQGNNGKVKVQVILGDETIWATQASMAEIFETSRENITLHLKNIFQSGELDEEAVCKKILHTANDGKRYNTNFYNLDVIISVGYRVNSPKATQFRIWATSVLKEYMIKGFALDDERLKQGKEAFGKDYFEELLERIREIRASERRFYQKITDIYAQCSIDYDPQSTITQEFYATVQNKLHYAIHQSTAAELVSARADSTKPHMGLSSWKNEKTGGKILKSDVSNAKNYLSKEELDNLNRIVSMYLDFAENLAKRQKPMKMIDWAQRLDAFLDFNEYDLLHNAGKISSKVAKQIAEREYEKFRVIQDRNYKSDFDNVIDTIKSTGKLPVYKTSPSSISISISGTIPSTHSADFDDKLKKALDYNHKTKKKD
jgi:Virulence protein